MVFVIGVSWNGNNLVYISLVVMVDDDGGEVKGGEIQGLKLKWPMKLNLMKYCTRLILLKLSYALMV